MKIKKIPKQYQNPASLGESQKTPQGETLQGASGGFFYARRHLARFNTSSFSAKPNFFQKTNFEFLTDLVFYGLLTAVVMSTVRGCTDPSDGHFGNLPNIVSKSYHQSIAKGLNPETEFRKLVGAL